MTRAYVVRAAVAALWALLLSVLPATAVASEYVTFLHADVQGSPLVATDEQGQVVWREEYEPWGARQVKDPASATASRGSEAWYTGKEEEADLGLYYYGARWHSPNVGAFTATDPAGVTLENPRSFNRYAYANNNPIRYTDPDGRSPLDVAFLAYDVAKFAHAVYKGEGVGTAAVDMGMSVLGVLSPMPGTGQMLKTAMVADRAADKLAAVGKLAGVAKGADGAAGLVAKGAARSADDLLRPGGELIGTVQRGATPNIRTVSPQEFAKLQEQLLSGAKPAGQYAGGKGAWHELPGGGRVGVRTSDKSGVTLDIDLPGFPPGFKVHQQ